MRTKEQWDRAFELTVPIASVGIGALSVALGIMALSGPRLGQRIYYEDGQYLVAVRYPGQWNELRDFVQPDNPDVIAVCSQIGPDVWGCLDWVCQNISYRRDIGEFWQTPSETLSKGQGDCEDSANLLTSLIRAGGAPNCYVALGSLGGYGHAWCEHNGQILETTYTSARPVANPEDYQGLVAFNNCEVIESYPGALRDVFSIGRNEPVKLCLMAQALDGIMELEGA